MSFFNLFFSLEGRISRKYFWLGLVALIAANIFLTLLLAWLIGVPLEQFNAEISSLKVSMISIATDLIFLYPSLAVTAKRLHDRGRSMLIGVVFIVLSLFTSALGLLGLEGTADNPNMVELGLGVITLLIALGLLVYLGFLRGQKGENRYGPDPLAHLAQQEA